MSDSTASGSTAPGSALEVRRARILEELRRNRRVEVAELSIALDVAEETVRRDLRALEEGGLLRRAHGGAIPPSTGEAGPNGRASAQVAATNAGASARADGARLVALTVMPLLPAGGSVYLDAGPVGEALAEMTARAGLRRIVTASVPVALAAAAAGAAAAGPAGGVDLAGPSDLRQRGESARRIAVPEVDLLGGVVDQDGTATGHWGRQLASTLRIDLAVLEPLGFAASGRMLAADPERAALSEAAVSAAGAVVVAVNAARAGDEGFAGFSSVTSARHVVRHPDAVLGHEVLQLLAESGITVSVAKSFDTEEAAA
jgi:DeoR family fructose operon transcriptional repressor